MKGIILAGGKGTRLYPATLAVSKQLLPVYDKPMIYYPISVLMLARIREILIISTPRDLPRYHDLLGDGRQFGVRFEYAAQERPDGLPQAYIIAEEFLEGQAGFLVLGDNVVYGGALVSIVRQAASLEDGGRLFAYRVRDPERFGVIEFDGSNRVLGLEEKPANPRSNWAAIGLYVFGPDAPGLARGLKPSHRGELEILDLAGVYLERGNLSVQTLGRGIAWLDTGTPEALAEASLFIHTVEARQGVKIACLEEIGFRSGWLSRDDVERRAAEIGSSSYTEYLRTILTDTTPFGTQQFISQAADTKVREAPHA